MSAHGRGRLVAFGRALRRRGKLLVRLAGLGLFLMVLVLVDIRAMLRALFAAHWPLVAFAFVLQATTLLLKSHRWRLLLATAGVRCSALQCFSLYAASGLFGIVTPGRVGELWRVVELKRRQGAPLLLSLPATLADRILDFYIYLLLGVTAAAAAGLAPEFGTVLWIVIVLLLVLPPLSLHPRLLRPLAALLFRNRLARRLPNLPETADERFVSAAGRLVECRLVVAVLVTLLTACLLAFQFWLVCASLGLRVSVGFAFLAVGLLKLVAALPLTVAGVGTRDMALLLLFDRSGLPVEIAVATSILLLLVTQVGVALIGGLCLGFDRHLWPSSNGSESFEDEERLPG